MNRFHRMLPLRTLAVALSLGAALPRASAKEVLIKLGTLAPEGSAWHSVLKESGEKWKELSKGSVKLRVYPGGVLGNEADMVRKIRVGQLHAATLSGIGLGEISPALEVFAVPMMVESYEELDFMLERMGPRLEKILEDKGFVTLSWGDAGFVHFFTKQPVSRPEQMKEMKVFSWTGEPAAIEAFKAAGFMPVAISANDILQSLQTGLLDAFDNTPLMALGFQWFALAKNMVDVRWAALPGATVVTKKAWDEIPAELRPALLAAGKEAGRRHRDEIRDLGEQAVEEMKKRGLHVVTPSAEDRALWRAAAERTWPKIRGSLVPPEIFDEAKRLRDEFRAKQKGGR